MPRRRWMCCTACRWPAGVVPTVCSRWCWRTGEPEPGGPSRPTPCSSSSVPSRAPNGSARTLRATGGASSSPAPTWPRVRTSPPVWTAAPAAVRSPARERTGAPGARHWCMRPACPACSPLVTRAGARSSGSPPRSGTARSPSRSCTDIWRTQRCQRMRRGDAVDKHSAQVTEPGRPGQVQGHDPREIPTPATLRPLAPGMRWLLFTAAVLVLLAGFQLFVFTGRTNTFFAWTIVNPLAAAFLGAGYWASVSIEALAGRQRLWANARIAVPTVFVFTVLTLAATLMHLGQFHLGGTFAAGTRIVTWAWIAIYILVPALLLIVAAVQSRTPGTDPPRLAPLPAWLNAVLAAQAIILLGVGVTLFAAPAHAAPLWPWTPTPLVAQATGAWLISLGVAAAHARAERDARRLRPAAVGYVLLALLQAIALARYPHQFDWGSPAGIIYLVFLGVMLLTGAAGLALGLRQTSPD